VPLVLLPEEKGIEEQRGEKEMKSLVERERKGKESVKEGE
jgi:hypothetical protein